MARKKIMFGVGAGVISLGVDGLSSLLILRLLTEYLSPEKAGFWILVTSAGSLLLLLQCGLGPTIARAVAGLTVGGDQTNQRELLGAVRSAFRYIAATVALTAAVIYLAYLWPTARAAGLNWQSALSWFPYALGMAANLQGQSSLFVLNGHGEVGWDKVFRSLFTVLGFGAVWGALLLGADLPALGLIYLAQNLLFWLVADLKLKAFLGALASPLPARPGQIKTLFHEGSKLLLLNLLTFLITQFTIFIVERRFGLTEVVSYAAMLRVGVLIGTIGSLLPQMLYPYVARAWAAQDYAKCRRYYLGGVLAAVGTALAISIPLYLFGGEVFALWLGDKVPYSAACFAAVLGFYVLYVFHSANATPALAVAGDAFTLPAIANAVMVLMLVFALSSAWGVIGVPVGMILGTLPASVYVVMRSWRIIMHPLGAQVSMRVE
jgi:O-antigen/teichoic acid export membrane protein